MSDFSGKPNCQFLGSVGYAWERKFLDSGIPISLYTYICRPFTFIFDR